MRGWEGKFNHAETFDRKVDIKPSGKWYGKPGMQPCAG
jgi:hypothetical protein